MSTGSHPAQQQLEDLLCACPQVLNASLTEKLRWLEQAAEATAAAELGAAGEQAAMELRAALGAVVTFAQSPQRQENLSVLALTVSTLIRRALTTVSGALAESYAALAAHDGPQTGKSKQLAMIWASIHRAMPAGQGLPAELVQAIQTLHR